MKYSKKHTIACYEADANQLMRPTAMLDLMQEAANVNATTLGFGFDEMKETNIAWVLSRMHVRFDKLPAWRQDVKDMAQGCTKTLLSARLHFERHRRQCHDKGHYFVAHN